MNTELPKRRGRPPGSFSFVKVKLQDLVSMTSHRERVEQVAQRTQHQH